MSELLNCPFCGGKEVRIQQNGRRPDKTWAWWEVACDDCDFVGPAADTRNDALTHWNRRAPVPLPMDAPTPIHGAIDLLCLSVQDVINGRLETGDAAADLAAVKEHLDTALKLTGFDGEAG
jgi:Lar family restriction alleviation protein